MRKLLSILLTFALLVSFLPTALAASGDLTVQYEDIGFEGSNAYLALLDGKIYMTDWYGNLFAVSLNGDAATLSPEEETQGDKNIMFLYSEKDKLYALCSQSVLGENDEYTTRMVLSEVVLSRENYSFGAETELDWSNMMVDYGGGETYPIYPNTYAYHNGYIMMSYYEDNGIGGNTYAVLDIANNLISKPSGSDGESQYINSIWGYGDGFAILVSNWETSQLILYTVNPDTCEKEEIAAYSEEELGTLSSLSGIVYDEANDQLYATLASALYVCDGMDLTSLRLICEVPYGYSDGSALLINETLYVRAGSDALGVRNVNLSERPSEKMVLETSLSYNADTRKAVNAFQSTHGNLEMVMQMPGSWNSDTVLESFMNGDSSVDLYTLYISENAFSTLYRRGYMAAMESEKIRAFVDEMYPAYADFAMRNGEVVCLPLQIYSNSGISLNRKVMEKMDITEADVPKDMAGFLSWLNDLAHDLSDESTVCIFDSWTDVREIRYSLYGLAMRSYMAQLTRDGEESKGFMTDELLETLEAIDSLDFTAMGVPEVIDWEGEYISTANEDKEALVNLYGGYLLEELSSSADRYILMLSVGKGKEPAGTVQGYAIFINPYSKHVAEAVEFVEALIDSMDETTRYTLSPKDNRPVRASYYENTLKSYQEWLKEIETLIEEETDAEQLRTWEEERNNVLTSLEEIDQNYWDVSEQGIALYQEMVKHLNFGMYSILETSEIYSMMNQAMNGEISARDFLTELNRRYSMMLQEGN